LFYFDRDETARYERFGRERVGVPRRSNCARHIEIENDEEIDADAASRADEQADSVVRIGRDRPCSDESRAC